MSDLHREKLAQAVELVQASDLDVWITFVRETAEGGDPVLPLMMDGGLTWQSALLVARTGEKVAIVGNFDAEPLAASGVWDEVIPYVQGIRDPLVLTLERIAKSPTAKLGVNFSTDDVKADGLSHGMFLLLESYLAGTRFANSLVSAETVATALRSQKTATEISRMRDAIAQTDEVFRMVSQKVRPGMSEREIYDMIHAWIDGKGLGYSWDPAQDPIVNSGPNSMVGHGIPSADIRIEEGHIFHIDLGITKNGYSSDIQRCWYVGNQMPDDVAKAMDAVTGAITVGSQTLKPGVEGWTVDKAARDYLVSCGYEEYLHAFGHQVGRVAHDGGAILGPKWERYGRTPTMPIQKDQVYTLELGVNIEGRGYLGIEEMVLITDKGVEWLSQRQLDLPLLG
jgi:Xaa-Pro dipeptidase